MTTSHNPDRPRAVPWLFDGADGCGSMGPPTGPAHRVYLTKKENAIMNIRSIVGVACAAWLRRTVRPWMRPLLQSKVNYESLMRCQPHDLLQRMSPLLAQSGHSLLHRICPLSGVKRTSLGGGRSGGSTRVRSRIVSVFVWSQRCRRTGPRWVPRPSWRGCVAPLASGGDV